MFEITNAEKLAEGIKLVEVKAPSVAKNAMAGQFVVLRINEKGERFPLTIYDFDKKKGTVSIVFLEVGKSTKLLGSMKKGDKIADFVGPLGHPFKVGKYGTVVCVGGGVGVPATYPIARALKEAGNNVISIIGARCRDLLILEDEMRGVCQELCMTTDDGSYCRKGFVTDVLKELIEKQKIDLVVAVGPIPMMKAVSDVTRGKVKTIVSLNPIMVDGTGMCGACRVVVGGKVRFACVDGPDFDAHEVDFGDLVHRNKTYLAEEKKSVECCGGVGACRK